MSPRRFLFSLCLSAAPVIAVAQKPVVYKEPRILLLVDGSSSMLQAWDGKENRFQTATRFIDALMDSMYRINPDVAFALRMYGQQSPAQDNNCYDTKREVMFSKNNRDQMGLRLASLHPYGVSPIAYSLQRAAEEDLTDEHLYSYSIILITDGGESCGGDLCAVSKVLEQRAIFFHPYIVSLVDYAPLKEQYQCLGEYLTTAKQAEVKPTIKTILDAYRPLLRAVSETPVEAPRSKPPVVVSPPKPVPTLPVIVGEKAMAVLLFLHSERPFAVQFSPLVVAARRIVPSLKLPSRTPDEPVVVVTPPPSPPVRTEIAALPFRNAIRPFVVEAPKAPAARTLIISALKLPAPEEVPTPVEPLRFLARGPSAEAPKAPPVARVLLIPALNRPAPEEEPVAVEPLSFILRRQRIQEMTAPVFAARLRAIPTLPRPKQIEDPKPPTPKPKPNDKPEPIEFNARTERAEASGIMVFFTNGKGKYYKSSPQVEVRESKTGKVVKRFFRTTGPNGEPDLQAVPPGTYDVVVPGKSNVMARNIPIGANETMNLQLVVTNGSLRFSYSSNVTRPMTEFTALVRRRFADDFTDVKQKGTEELSYEPGTYFAEINTLPITRRNLDIEFGSITDVQIAEPGWVQFTNTLPVGSKLVLYQPLGDGFASFHKVELTGDLAEQKIRLQPGTYEARLTSGTPGTLPVIVRFVVESNLTTMKEMK